MRKLSGWVLFAATIGLLIYNVSDLVTDLHEWHGVATFSPEFVGAIMRRVGESLLALATGQVIPTLAIGRSNDDDRVSAASVERLKSL